MVVNKRVSFLKIVAGLCLLFSQFPALMYAETIQKDSMVHKAGSLANKPWPVSRYSARMGAFWAISSTDVGAGIKGRDYTDIDFENDLNMSKNTFSGMLNLDARFGKHNRVDFSYFNIYRNTKASLEKEIHFGEHTYPVDSRIKAYLNTNIFRLSYGYSFISNPKLELGALIGFHMMAFNIGMEFDGITQDLSYNDDVKFTAPLPDLGIWGTYAINNHWAVSTEFSYFYVKYKDLTGRILNANLYAQYGLSKHWEIDLGYNVYDVFVNLDRKRLESNLTWGYSGPFVCVAYKFGK